MDTSLIQYEIRDRVAYLTLNRPEKRNALDDKMVTALLEGFKKALADDEAKVIVLGANGKAFCAGADLAYLEKLQTNTYEENLADSRHLMSLFKLIYTCEKVVIASIQGHAIAGGCGLASVCDFSIAVPEAKFGYSEVHIGFVPAIVSYFLLRKIGEGRAKDLLLSGRIIGAEEAAQLGMINRVVSAEALGAEVEQLAGDLCNKNSGQSMKLTKQLIATVQDVGLEEGMNIAAETNAEARATDDCKKGIGAFLNKEDLSW